MYYSIHIYLKPCLFSLNLNRVGQMIDVPYSIVGQMKEVGQKSGWTNEGRTNDGRTNDSAPSSVTLASAVLFYAFDIELT